MKKRYKSGRTSSLNLRSMLLPEIGFHGVLQYIVHCEKKLFAPLSIGILLSWVAFTLYMAIMDVLTYGHLGYFLFPTELTLVQMFFPGNLFTNL